MRNAGLAGAGLLCAALLAQTGCAASTRLHEDLAERGFNAPAVHRVVVVDATHAGAARRVFEDRFATALAGRGIDGEASHVLAGDELPDSTRGNVQTYRGHGDGVLVTRVAEDRIRRSLGDASVGFPLARGQTSYGSSRAKGPVIENRVVETDIRLYRVADGKLLWSGLARSSSPKSDAPEKQIDPIVHRLVPAMEKAGVLLRTGR